MKSVEEELNEIEADWEVSYLDLTDNNHRYRIELKKEEVILRLSIPEDYPGIPPEFEFGEKEIDEKMQRSTLCVAQQNLSGNIGKPMIGSLLENIWKHIKSAAMVEKDPKISENFPAQAIISPKRPKKRTKGKLACNFDVELKSTIKKSLNDSTYSKESTTSQKVKIEPKARDKAPRMKTARDVINRLKWDDQLKNEEFIVGYEDRFEGVIEVPVFDLNWKDDIASTGPADKLAIPEHRVQYFKFNSHLVWEKASRMDLIFGSTGSKTDITNLVQRWKKQQKQNEDNAAQELSAVKVILDNPEQTNEEKYSSVVDIGSAEISMKEIIETADETPQVTACEKADENPVEETAGIYETSRDQTEKTEEDMTSPAMVEMSWNASRVDNELEIGVREEIDEVMNDMLYQIESIDIDDDQTEKTEEDMTSPAMVETSWNASRVDNELEIGVREEIDEVMNDMLYQIESIDIDDMTSPAMVETSWDASRVDNELEIGVQEEIDEVMNDMLYQIESIDIDEDMTSAVMVETSWNASRVDNELEIGVQEEIDEVMNDMLYQIESIDIDANNASPREVAGGRQRYDGDGGYSKSFSRGHRGGQSHPQRSRRHGRRRHHNRDEERSGRGGGRRDGSRYDSRDRSQHECPNPNFSIGIKLDDSSNEKLSNAIAHAATDTEKIQIRRTEDCYGSMSNLYIPSLSDASKVVTALKSACQNWKQIYSTVSQIDVDCEDVTVSIYSKSLLALHKKISRSIQGDARSYNFQYSPHIRIGTTPDAQKKVLRFEEDVDLKIIGLHLFKIEEPNFDIRRLSAVKFDLQIQDEQDKHTERKRDWKDSYGHERGEGRGKRSRLQKGRRWETNISKRLSAILRHGAMGFKIDEEGFIKVKTLLAHRFFNKNSVEEEDIAQIVENNAKKRFALEGNPGDYKIRANQGHTVQVENLHLEEVTNAEDFPKVVHGTRMKVWDSIHKRGLDRMRRNHIHMTTSEPRGDEELISGMRKSSNCFVYINLAKAMTDGIKFFLSDNGVILSEGVDGVLDRKYFSHAAGIRNGKRIDLPIEREVPSSNDRLHETSSAEHSEDHSETKDPATSRDE